MKAPVPPAAEPTDAAAARLVPPRRESGEDLLDFLRAATRGLVVLHRSRLEPGTR